MTERIYWPFNPDIISEYPGKSSLAIRPNHYGTDFPVPAGSPYRAPVSGTVYMIWNDGLGAYVMDIVTPSGFVCRGGHFSYMDPALECVWVDAGDFTGALTGGVPGTPGAGMSTGSHLHLEFRDNRRWDGIGWFDPRDLDMHKFSELDTSIDTNIQEINMNPFSGESTRKTKQVIRENNPTTLTYLDNQEDSAYGNRTIARGPGEIHGLVVNVRVKGAAGKRVEFQLVRETADNSNRVLLCEERREFDSLGVASAHLAFSGPVTKGQLIRVIAHTQSGSGNSTLERMTWSGFAVPKK